MYVRAVLRVLWAYGACCVRACRARVRAACVRAVSVLGAPPPWAPMAPLADAAVPLKQTGYTQVAYADDLNSSRRSNP